jgi:hypothetical protein
MTRKTSLYKIKSDKKTIVYRDLTVLEISYLSNIKNDLTRKEMAAKIAIIEPLDSSDIPWPILQKIGDNTLSNSVKWIQDKQLFEILVKECREDIKEGTSPLAMIRQILQVFPGQSITELLKLTWRDLVEIACMAEITLGKKIFDVGGLPVQRKGSSLMQASAFEDDGQSLQEKMNALNASLGGIPK